MPREQAVQPVSIEFGDGFAAFFADGVGEDADEVLVVDVLFAVGHGDEAVIRLLQLFAGEGEAELFEAMAEGGASTMAPGRLWRASSVAGASAPRSKPCA